jgi:hypothetical protein
MAHHNQSILTVFKALNASSSNIEISPIDINISTLADKVNIDMIELRLIEKILAIINFLFIVLGTFGNLLTFAILMRKNVRKHSCMRYLAALSLLDLFCLYTWNFSFVYSNIRNKKVEHEGALICRFFSFFCYFILQTSSWIICAIGLYFLFCLFLIYCVLFR